MNTALREQPASGRAPSPVPALLRIVNSAWFWPVMRALMVAFVGLAFLGLAYAWGWL